MGNLWLYSFRVTCLAQKYKLYLEGKVYTGKISVRIMTLFRYKKKFISTVNTCDLQFLKTQDHKRFVRDIGTGPVFGCSDDYL